MAGTKTDARRESMANKKTKRRSNWTPPRTSGSSGSSGTTSTREAGPARARRDATERSDTVGARQARGPAAGRGAQAPPATRGAPAPAANRQARKEEARRQREALRRKAARRRTARLVGIVTGIMAVLIGIVLVVALGHHKGTTSSAGNNQPNPATLDGILQTAPPWPANDDPTALRSRLQAIGLHALGAEGTVEHIHMHLDIFVHGQKVTVPANIGIASDTSFGAELHTHDTSGIIHFESPKDTTFTLGQFFDDWGVYFTKRCIGSLCDSGDNQLRVYVDGKQLTTDPTTLAFQAHQVIVVTYGTDKELPNPIPKSYNFGTL